MFRHITFHCADPICKCAEEKLEWLMKATDKGPALEFRCILCKTSLRVTGSQVTANFQFVVPYRGLPQPVQKVTLSSGGQVIPFKRK